MELILELRWDTVALLTLAIVAILILYLRIEKKARGLSLFFLVIPAGYIMYKGAEWQQRLPELFFGFLSGGILYLIWHQFYGQRIPLPSSDNIKVWGQEE